MRSKIDCIEPLMPSTYEPVLGRVSGPIRAKDRCFTTEAVVVSRLCGCVFGCASIGFGIRGQGLDREGKSATRSDRDLGQSQFEDSFIDGFHLVRFCDWNAAHERVGSSRHGIARHHGIVLGVGLCLVSGTWAMATWDSGWEQSEDGTVVNMGGVSAFWIAIGAVCWITVSIAVWWILTRPRTREASHFHDRGLSSPGALSE